MLALGLGCVSRVDVSRVELDGWRELRTPWFTLIGDLPEEELQRFADELAVFVALARRVTTMPDEPPRGPARFFLLADATWDRLPDFGASGFLFSHLDGYDSAVALRHTRGAARGVLFHEYGHFLLRHRKQVALPVWYDEGFAELLSSVRVREGRIAIGDAVERAAAAAGPPIPLSTIFGVRDRSEMRDPYTFYAGAWAATHYLSTSRERRAQMQAFVDRLAAGEDWETAYGACFDVSIETLSRRVRNHARRVAAGVPLLVVEVPLEALDVDHAFSVRVLTEAEAAAALGDFGAAMVADAWTPYGLDHGERRLLALAEAFRARAVSSSGGDPRHRAAHADSLARRGDADAARVEAATALAAAPQDPQVLLHVAMAQRALCERSEGEEAKALRHAARGLFERARDADPQRPGAWAGIGWSYVESGDPPAPGIAALEQARRLAGWDEQLNLDLAELYVAAGERERGISRLEEVARFSDSRETAERARARIASLQAAGSAGEDR